MPKISKSKLKKLKLFQIKITTIFLGLLGFFAILFVSYFLYFQSAITKEIDHVLPNENLILFTEFSKDDVPEMIANSPYIQQILIESNLQKYLNQSIDQFQIKTAKWLGDEVGLALYKNFLGGDDLIYYLFLESQDDKAARNFLRDLGVKGEELKLEKYLDFQIISFPQSLNIECSFMYGYFICSNTEKAIQRLIDLNQNKLEYVSNFNPYNKIKNNLPQKSLGKIYLNFQNLDFDYLEFYLGPLKEYVNQAGLTFTDLDNGIKLNSYLSFEKGFTQTGYTLTKNNLKNYIHGENLVAYFEGENLTKSIKQIFQIWDNITPNFSLIIEGVLRGHIKEYFENAVTLEEDFYPLLENKYALGLYLEPDSLLPHLSLILESLDEDNMKKVMERMHQGFLAKSGQYLPSIKEITLPDGNIVKDLVVDESKVKEEISKYENVDIYSVDIQNMPYHFSYAMAENKIFIATHKDIIKKDLAAMFDAGLSFSETEAYLNLKENIALEGDEFSFLNLKQAVNLLDAFTQGMPYSEVLSLFDYASFSTKWFDDGMANEVIFLQKESN